MVPEVRILLVPLMEKLLVHYFKDSSTLFMCAWDLNSNDLMVVFNSKAVWLYKKVPSYVHQEFIDAHSAGAYFNKNIRNMYHSLCMYKEWTTVG